MTKRHVMCVALKFKAKGVAQCPSQRPPLKMSWCAAGGGTLDKYTN